MGEPLALRAALLPPRLKGGRLHEPPRPPGPLLWVHSEEQGRLPALLALAGTLRRTGARTLLTLPAPDGGGAIPDGADAILRPAPPDRLARAFAAHWAPDLLLWVGGALRPALVAAAPARLLIEGAPRGPLLRGRSWVPGLARAAVQLFERALVPDAEAAGRLRRAGLPPARIALGAPLDAPVPVLPCDDRERRDLAGSIGARPVWLALDVPPAEVNAVLAAHARASRAAHRLLLILAPRDPHDAAPFARAAAAAGLRPASRAEGEEPGEEARVLVADGPGEAGTWLRLAPLAYLGGTLPGGPGGRHPFEAAALGSALLHGPVLAPHEGAWARLGAAGAGRLVRAPEDLGAAVEALLAPDRAALMAQGAWDVTTAGAGAAQAVADLVAERLRPS